MDSTKIKEFEEKVISKMADKDKPKNDEFYIQMYKEYARNQRKDTPPYEDDTISQSDFGARAYADDVKMEMDNANESAINEEGVAGAVAGNGSGMGAVTTQAELDKRCELAREKKLKPMREKLIEECVTEKRKEREYCTNFYSTYGDAIHHANGRVQPRMFHDLPECLKAFESSRSYRSDK